jgi:hypothetical protein
MTSGHEVQALGVQLSPADVDALPPPSSWFPMERDLNAMTVTVAQSRVAELKQRLRDFREEFMDLCDRDGNPEVVYQVNIQLFPLSRRPATTEAEGGPQPSSPRPAKAAKSKPQRPAKRGSS